MSGHEFDRPAGKPRQSSRSSRLRVGALWNKRYLVSDRIGAGGMSTVYRAYDTKLQRDVALKTQTNLREGQAIAKLEHPNIVQVFDYVQQRGTTFIVMEFVDGCSLQQRLSGASPLELSEIMDILSAVAGALDFAHASGVLHRDVKPANILLRSDGRVKVADFGIAKIVDAVATTGLPFGTPPYTAPEQYAGRASPKSDQFSLAVMASQLVLAHPDLASLVHCDPAEVDIWSPYFGSVLRRAAELNLAMRFDSCVKFVESLRKSIKPTFTDIIRGKREPGALRAYAGKYMLGELIAGLINSIRSKHLYKGATAIEQMPREEFHELVKQIADALNGLATVVGGPASTGTDRHYLVFGVQLASLLSAYEVELSYLDELIFLDGLTIDGLLLRGVVAANAGNLETSATTFRVALRSVAETGPDNGASVLSYEDFVRVIYRVTRHIRCAIPGSPELPSLAAMRERNRTVERLESSMNALEQALREDGVLRDSEAQACFDYANALYTVGLTKRAVTFFDKALALGYECHDSAAQEIERIRRELQTYEESGGTCTIDMQVYQVPNVMLQFGSVDRENWEELVRRHAPEFYEEVIATDHLFQRPTGLTTLSDAP